MSYPSRIAASVFAVTVGSLLLPGCGGEFSEGGADGGSAGSAAKGGSSGKGGSGSAGSGSGGSAGSSRGGTGGGGGSCEFEGHVYEDGESFPAGDDCNTCSCSAGEVGCTLLDCPEQGCVYDGVFHPVGEVFPDLDGCNTCSCDSGGTISCTLIACNECTSLASEYSAALDEARTCDPMVTGQCSQLTVVGLQCGCDSFVNPEQSEAIAKTQSIQAQYAEQACGGGVACGLCAPPVSSYCSTEGRCVDVYEYGPGASCKVEGVVYESGASNVPDPVSCNTCTCTDGQLACDNSGGVDCQELCPPDTIYASQCVQCGNTDGCEVLEHACLPTCTDACQAGVCISGVCKTICG